MSRSITMNGVTATINFLDTPNPNDKPVHWELVIENGIKRAFIDGYNIPAPAVIPPPATGTATGTADYEYKYDGYNIPVPIIPVPATGTADYDSDSLPEDFIEDSVMLKKHFQDENLTFNMEYMKWYYTCAKKTPTLNRSQKMKAFIDSNKDILMQFEEGENENRKMLMVSIFKKKNLEFKDVYMDMYYEWKKNAPKQNRYKKMCSFIEVHGFK